MESNLQSDVLGRLEKDPALAPTAQELSMWSDTVERLMAATKC